MDELRLDAGLRRDPPGRDRRVALLEHAAARPRPAASARVLRVLGADPAREPSPRHHLAMPRPPVLGSRTTLLCECTASAATEHGSTETGVSDWADDRLLRRPVARRGPVPLLRAAARGSARCCRSPHLGVVAVTGYDEATRGLPRRRHVLVVQLGDRSVRHVPGAARGRRRRRHHRPATATSSR